MNFLAFVLFLPLISEAQPYYAAKKGLNCSACHVGPSGGGMRKPTQTSPAFINDAFNVGGDLRAYFLKLENTNSTFATPRSAFYIAAQPVETLSAVYSNDQGSQAEFYGMVRHPDYPLYARAGRFFVPYGLQLADPDNSSYIKISPFAPTIGFSMFPSQSDTGIEIGMNPKNKYFAHLALTNGSPNSGADNSNAKAFTSRFGFTARRFSLGSSFYSNRTSDLPAGQKEIRYSGFGWVKAGPVVLLGEAGWGENESNATQKTTDLQAAHAELDFELLQDYLLIKGKVDHLDPNTEIKNDDVQRYTVASEWFALRYLSVETQYRIINETPRKANDQALVLTHVWF